MWWVEQKKKKILLKGNHETKHNTPAKPELPTYPDTLIKPVSMLNSLILRKDADPFRTSPLRPMNGPAQSRPSTVDNHGLSLPVNIRQSSPCLVDKLCSLCSRWPSSLERKWLQHCPHNQFNCNCTWECADLSGHFKETCFNNNMHHFHY